MRGVVLPGERRVEVREFPGPRPGPDDAIVQIRASGICGSDLRPYRAPAASRPEPLTISGHEPCGGVVEVGPNVPPQLGRPGDRVMVHHYSGCGVCKHCRVGYTQMCLVRHEVYGFSADGGNAPYLRVPASTLVRLPDELSFAEGAAIA